MKFFTSIILAAITAASAVHAHEGTVAPLLSADLPEIPGKEAVMIRVDYAPGDFTSAHRHDAHAMVYVLEGSVIMQVEGQEEKILKPGDTYYENPDDIHLVSRNASETEPAKFIVFILKDKDKEIVMPLE